MALFHSLSNIQLYIYTTLFFIHSSVNRNLLLGYWNTRMREFFQIIVFSRYKPRNGIAGSYGSSIAEEPIFKEPTFSSAQWLYCSLKDSQWSASFPRGGGSAAFPRLLPQLLSGQIPTSYPAGWSQPLRWASGLPQLLVISPSLTIPPQGHC